MPKHLLFVLWFGGLFSPANAQPVLPAIPEVVLSEQHGKLCTVGVGDPFPEITLPLVERNEGNLSTLLGRRATVIVFFQGKGWMTRTLLEDLPHDVVKVFGDKGVSVLGISVGAPAPKSDAFPLLTDLGGKAFARVGREKLPRVYVLDAPGNIVWFDLEYSVSTRRELRRTLESLTSNAE